MSRLFGWDLPPGCTHADIDRAYGGGDPSPESEEVCDLLEGWPQAEDPQKVQDAVVALVDKLACERNHLRELLTAALAKLPPDPPRPPCTCGYRNPAGWSYCHLHDSGLDEPSLREEIESFFRQEKNRDT